MENDALHIWPRGTYMLIALPNLDGSFTCTLYMPYSGHPGFDDLTTEAAVLDFFASRFPDAVPLMPSLLDDFFDNPIGPLGTVKCAPWSVGDQALLLGDAAHAIVPFFGQGMNCGFEDCTYLDACLDQHPGDWETIFRKFQAMRKVNTDAIADMAEANYLEMRDHVNDPAFVLQREVALALERRYPDVFIPQYSMVSFHRIPYAEARRRGETQAELLAELCAGLSSADEIDWQRADALIRQLPWADKPS
jgi:kynurenine 3-monooxygenase